MYEKPGGDFLWGYAQDTELTERVQDEKFTYGVANTSADSTRTTMPHDKVKEEKAVAKKDLKEEIVAMEILKRADKMRYGNLQISLKNSYLLGNKYYPGTILDVLRVLYN